MWLAGGWKDYELLDAGFGEKLERWGQYILRRPDPQAVWPRALDERAWDGADAVYHRSASGGGSWEERRNLPDEWEVSYGDWRFGVRLMQFKHTGVFPEQAANWEWIANKVRRSCTGRQEPPRVLNLFAYTGAATVAAASAGALVCHVDAARGIVAKAKENAERSLVPRERTRYIVDDVYKFVRRELRRGSRYDAVIMDPPSYGRGPGGELWKAEEQLYGLVELCAGLLGGSPLFFLINTYASGLSAVSAGNILRVALGGGRSGTKLCETKSCGTVDCDELGLPVGGRGIALPCGCSARYSFDQ